MIVDIIFFGISLLLQAILVLLNAITFWYPTWIDTAIANFFVATPKLASILPLTANPSATGIWHDVGIIDMVIYALYLLFFFVSYKVVMWVVGWLKHHKRPIV